MWGSSPEHQALVDHWLDWEASALKVRGGGPLVGLGGQRVEGGGGGGGGGGGPLVGLGGALHLLFIVHRLDVQHRSN